MPTLRQDAIIERIAPVLEYCEQRAAMKTAKIIVAAMAQNGAGFTVETAERHLR